MPLESDEQHSATRRIEAKRQSWRLIFAVAIVGTLGAGWWLLAWQSPVVRGNAALNQAYRAQRPLEARISGLSYAPLIQTRGGDTIETGAIAHERAERLLLDAVFNDPGPAARHALGRLYLARKKFDKAADQFTRALQAEPQNAPLLSDQGVATMEQSRTSTGTVESGEDVERLSIALDYFKKALEHDHDLPEAVFNRALLYQEMTLLQLARDEWRGYLKLDSRSPWADEARQNLRRLEETRSPAAQPPAQLLTSLRQAYQHSDDEQTWKIIGQTRDSIGSVVIDKLLDNYLSAITGGDQSEAGKLLETLLYAGALEARLSGDRFTNDLASFYRRAATVHRIDLLKARGWLKSGAELFESGKIEDAAAQLELARRAFSRLGDVCEALQAEYLLARCLRKQSDAERRSLICERLSRICSESRYDWLRSQILMAQAQSESGLANHSNVIDLAQRGLQAAQSGQDATTSATLLLQIAESYYKLGDYHESLKYYHEGLALVHRQSAKPFVRWALYLSIGLPLNALGRHATAVDYQRESLHAAHAIGDARQISRSHINLGLTYALGGDSETAVSHAKLAFESAQKIPGGYYRTESLALASLKLGQLFNQAGDTTGAVENFNRAIQLYGGLDSQEAFLYSAHKGKVMAFLTQGSATSLEEEINTTLELFEQYRHKIREENDRNIFFDAEQSIYDIAIDFWRSRKGDERRAFELAEQCRARSLLDSMEGAQRGVQDSAHAARRNEQITAPLTLAQIQERLPEQSQVAQYAALKDRLVIWVVSHSQPLVVREQQISYAELEKLVSAYLRLVTSRPTGDQTEITEAARRLYKLLIQPIEPFLDKRKQLCLAADKILNQLPYAALISPNSGRFLIEDYTLVFAPSATMFIACSDAASAKEDVKVERLLSVGDPAFDRKRFPLPYLEPARREAETVATYYYRPITLIGEKATKKRLLEEIGRFDVLHFALHGVVDERSPMRSKLLLAKTEREGVEPDQTAGFLEAHEIYRLPLSRPRLVVLAACRSGIERYYRGEGMMGISRAFIAKGVPLVVASLWDVDASATAELMIKFHGYRKLERLPSSAALRQAQLTLLRDLHSVYRSPYYWASFESIGGHSGF